MQMFRIREKTKIGKRRNEIDLQTPVAMYTKLLNSNCIQLILRAFVSHVNTRSCYHKN